MLKLKVVVSVTHDAFMARITQLNNFYSVAVLPVYYLHEIMQLLRTTKLARTAELMGKLNLLSKYGLTDILDKRMEELDGCLTGDVRKVTQ